MFSFEHTVNNRRSNVDPYEGRVVLIVKKDEEGTRRSIEFSQAALELMGIPEKEDRIDRVYSFNEGRGENAGSVGILISDKENKSYLVNSSVVRKGNGGTSNSKACELINSVYGRDNNEDQEYSLEKVDINDGENTISVFVITNEVEQEEEVEEVHVDWATT